MPVTVQSVINEIMFIAASIPDAIDITVEYTSVSDSLSVRVMPRGFDYINATTEGYCAAMLFSKRIELSYPRAIQDVLDAKSKILELMVMPSGVEVAA